MKRWLDYARYPNRTYFKVPGQPVQKIIHHGSVTVLRDGEFKVWGKAHPAGKPCLRCRVFHVSQETGMPFFPED